MNMKTKKRVAITLLLLPSLILLTVFSIIPLIFSLCISLTDWDMIGGSPSFVGLQNFASVLTNSDIYSAMLHVLTYMVMYVPTVIIISIPIAMLLNAKIPKMSFFRAVYYIPVLTSWVAAALIWKSALSQYGFVNQLLSYVGITGPSWLQSAVWAMPGIVIASVWKDVGYISMMFIGGLNSISPDYYEAANVDGANAFVRFFKITLPLLSPTLFFVLVTCIMSSLQVFTQVSVMTDGGPNNATMVLVQEVYNYAFSYFKMGYASAIAWLLFLITLVITVIQFRFQKKWVNYDA